MGSKDEQYEEQEKNAVELLPPFKHLVKRVRGQANSSLGEWLLMPASSGENDLGDSNKGRLEDDGYLEAGEQLEVRPIVNMPDQVEESGEKAPVEEPQNEPPKYRPYFVILVIIICTIMFLVSMGKNGWKLAPISQNPMLGPDSSVLIDLGAKVTSLIVAGEWWRLIAPMFLHAGLIHLLLNMITLWRLGTDLEETFGAYRIGAIYFLSGLFGILMSAIFLPEIPGVGASGAICGLLGAKFGDFFHYHKYLQEGKWKYFVSLVLSTVIALAIGLFPLLDNFGHIGGWICGLLSGTIFLAYAVKDPLSGKLTMKSFAVLACAAILLSFFVIAFSVLFLAINGNTWCSWCHNLSCLQGTPWWDCNQQYCQTVTKTYSNGTVIQDCEPI